MQIGLEGIEWNSKRVDEIVKEFTETLNSGDDVSFTLKIEPELANKWIMSFNFRNRNRIILDKYSKVFASNYMICVFGKVR